MKLVGLVPFGYYMATRLNTPRDFLYLVATQWISGIWLVYRLGEVDLPRAAGLYAVGYLAFIAIYEIGYFANDTWDANRQPDARRRFPYAIGAGYAVAFVGIRIALWSAIAVAWGRLGDPEFLALYGALVVVFTLHNLLTQNHLRLATFVQLAFLRFSAPVMFALGGEDLLLVLFVCTVFYLSFRTLAYLDSKNLLSMPGRKDANFGFLQTVLVAPLAVLVTVATSEPVILELFAYFTVVYGLYALRSVGAKE